MAKLSPEMKKAIAYGMADAWEALAEARKPVDAGRVKSGDFLGTREHSKSNYLYRMLAAVLIIYITLAKQRNVEKLDLLSFQLAKAGKSSRLILSE